MSGEATEQAARRRGSVAALFGLTLFASALLMFLVQPMFAKMALPRLGGSSAVWSLALVFFQAVLLLGYGYAHLLVRLLPMRVTVAVHVLVTCLALASLPIAIAAGWDAPPEQGPAFWLLGLFAVSVGLPFFALSANAPLLQAWFARAGQARSDDPYFLYAASNAGSFVALLAYPFLVEPLLGLVPQSRGWSLGYALLILLIALCGVVAVRAGRNAAAAGIAEARAEATPVGWAERLCWMVYALLPTGLLVAATAYISMDLVAAPFLWVVPLAIYLLTFVIAFQARPLIPHQGLMARIGLYGTALAIATVPPILNIYLLPVHLLLCFLLMLACHGELARRRPAASRLTEFYFFVSLGGVIGGILASLVAPAVFRGIYEYPLLVILTLAALGLAGGRKALDSLAVKAGLVALPLLVGLFYLYLQLKGPVASALLFVSTGVLLAWLALGRRQPLAMALLLAAVIGCYSLAMDGRGQLTRSRSFYGVLTVRQSDDGQFHKLQHGTTAHGWQRVLNADGTPVTGRPQSQAYYYAAGPFGAAVRALRAARPDGRLDEVALVGLGTGSLLCLSEPGERWRFFEIDPQVVTIASDPRYFTFLSGCGPAAGITIGDGRLQLAKVPDGSFDLIVLDAFSSDSIPAHLLTREALALYMAKLKPGGIAVFHTSNRFMDLSAVVASAAASLGFTSWHAVGDPGLWAVDRSNGDALPMLVVVAKTAGSVPALDADPRWQRDTGAGDAPAWTDDYSNIPGAIWRMLRQPPAAKP